ncbi:MAG: hypothetical protein QMC40_07485 [Vicingaceae bacterium]|jgi:hypothetical protein
MKKVVWQFSLVSGISVFSKEFTTNSIENFMLRAGFNSSILLVFVAGKEGCKVELDVPIYKCLGATFT